MKKINFKIILIILIVTIVGITTYYFKTKDESVENIEVEETNTQSQETNTEEKEEDSAEEIHPHWSVLY